MKIELSLGLKAAYPNALFGSLIARDVPNVEMHAAVEERKRLLEKRIREADAGEDDTIRSYINYFKRWGATYPIQYQVETIRKGGRFPQVSALVDSMFLAELKNGHLTSGHDLDAIRGDLAFDVSQAGERYLKLNGKGQELEKGDVILRDREEVLAGILYGPARRTSITLGTKNALYLAWYPYGMGEELIAGHLNDILSNLGTVFGSVSSRIQIHR